MKQLSKLVFLGFSLGAALSGNSALAEVSAQASLVVTGFQLVDLDVNDGVSPDIFFHSIGNTSYSVVGASRSSSDIYQYHSIGNLLPNSSSVALNGVSASGSYDGGAFGALRSQGRVDGEGNFRAYQAFSSAFTLTAHTQLILIGRGSGATSLEGGNFPGEQRATTTTYLTLRDNDFTQYANFSQYGANFETDFRLDYFNVNATSRIGWVQSAANVDGLRMNSGLPPDTSPVPEPETWAIMLAGLGLLGLRARQAAARHTFSKPA